VDKDPLGCSGYGIWFLWLLANIIGMGVGWYLGWRLSFAVPGNLAIWVIGIVAGLSLGFFQMLVLRSLIGTSIWWLLASMIGWAVGFFLGAQAASFFGFTEFVFGGAIGAGVGLASGIAQWSILRGKMSSVGWWIPASVVAWAASLIVYLPGANAVGLLYGGVSGGISGLTLLALWLGIFRKTNN